ncbi:MAG: acyl carrier protein [Planctomycetaceae bacterium]|nr:acyl carrier protein [Planctomycetaceae bacterium]
MSGPLSESEIETKVIETIADQLGVAKSEVTRESEFDKICDSLDKAELMMEFEDRFEISITDESASKLTRVSDAIEFIQRTLAGSR